MSQWVMIPRCLWCIYNFGKAERPHPLYQNSQKPVIVFILQHAPLNFYSSPLLLNFASLNSSYFQVPSLISRDLISSSWAVNRPWELRLKRNPRAKEQALHSRKAKLHIEQLRITFYKYTLPFWNQRIGLRPYFRIINGWIVLHILFETWIIRKKYFPCRLKLPIPSFSNPQMAQ